MRALIVAATLVCVAGCVNRGGVSGADSAEAVKPAEYRNEFSVRIHPTPAAEVSAACKRLGIHAREQIFACSRFHRDVNLLEMWVVDPVTMAEVDRFRSIGHELWHGARGAYHW